MSRSAPALGQPGGRGCNEIVNTPDEPPPADILDVLPAELERCSALADELAHLLLPAHLFG